MPCHDGTGVSAAVETSSRVLRPIVRAVERIRATTQGRTPERKASTPAYLSKSWMRAAMSRMMKKEGRTTPSVAQSAPSTPPCEEPMKGHVDGQRAGGGFRHCDEAQKLGLGEPAMEQDFFPDEGDHAVAAAEGDGTDLQKGEE